MVPKPQPTPDEARRAFLSGQHTRLAQLASYWRGHMRDLFHPISVSWSFKPDGALVYKDETIEIVAEKGPSKRILITKLDNHNPVVCTNETGEAYRWHGEYARLAAHARRLATACEGG